VGDLEDNVTQKDLDFPSSNTRTEGLMVTDTSGGIELEIVYFSVCATLVTLLNIVIDPIRFDTVMDGVLRSVGRHIIFIACK
jgi:hypothetical protein